MATKIWEPSSPSSGVGGRVFASSRRFGSIFASVASVAVGAASGRRPRSTSCGSPKPRTPRKTRAERFDICRPFVLFFFHVAHGLYMWICAHVWVEGASPSMADNYVSSWHPIELPQTTASNFGERITVSCLKWRVKLQERNNRCITVTGKPNNTRQKITWSADRDSAHRYAGNLCHDFRLHASLEHASECRTPLKPFRVWCLSESQHLATSCTIWHR